MQVYKWSCKGLNDYQDQFEVQAKDMLQGYVGNLGLRPKPYAPAPHNTAQQNSLRPCQGLLEDPLTTLVSNKSNANMYLLNANMYLPKLESM